MTTDAEAPRPWVSIHKSSTKDGGIGWSISLPPGAVQLQVEREIRQALYAVDLLTTSLEAWQAGRLDRQLEKSLEKRE